MRKQKVLYNGLVFSKGTFHTKMGKTQGRNGKELTKAEEIKTRWQEYTELYKKDLYDLDNHDGVVTHLEPDILDCKIRWALGSITTNKVINLRWWNSSRAISNRKWWCCESAARNMSANLENSAMATGLEKVSFHSNPRERQCQRMLKLQHSSLQFSSSVMSDSLLPHRLPHTRLPCPSRTPGTCSHSCPSSQWCHPIISSSVVPFSSCLQFFPATGSFPKSQFFPSGGQSIGVSASASLPPMISFRMD